MKDETRDLSRDLLWALPASLILHAVFIALLAVYGLPRSVQQLPEEQPVSVTFVPAPEEPKAKPAPPPPPKEAKVEKPPEEAKVEKPPEPKVQKALPLEPHPPMPARIEVLKPVFQYGEKDGGPRKSQGGSSEDRSPSVPDDNSRPPLAAKDPPSKPAVSAQPEKVPDATDPSEQQATAAKASGSAPEVVNETAQNQDIARQPTEEQGAPKSDAGSQTAALEAAPLPTVGDGDVALPDSAKVPQPRPSAAPKAGPTMFSKPISGGARRANPTDGSAATSKSYSGLPGVRRLNSQVVTGDPFASTATAGVPRDQRIARLCASELQQQLVSASYTPDLVPLVPLKAGNVLDIPETAFRTRTTWHRLGFRCEVDPGATRVLSFDFRVGTTIPRDEWARLGLPMTF